jgi:hypothetical protein
LERQAKLVPGGDEPVKKLVTGPETNKAIAGLGIQAWVVSNVQTGGRHSDKDI